MNMKQQKMYLDVTLLMKGSFFRCEGCFSQRKGEEGKCREKGEGKAQRLHCCWLVWPKLVYGGVGTLPIVARPPPHCTTTVRDKCNTHWGAYRESVTFSLSGDPPMQTEYKCGHKNSTSLLNYITWFRKWSLISKQNMQYYLNSFFLIQ